MHICLCKLFWKAPEMQIYTYICIYIFFYILKYFQILPDKHDARRLYEADNWVKIGRERWNELSKEDSQKWVGSACRVQNDNLFDSLRIYEIRYWIMNQVSLDGINSPIARIARSYPLLGQRKNGENARAKLVDLFYALVLRLYGIRSHDFILRLLVFMRGWFVHVI